MNEKKKFDLDLQLFATAGNTTGSNTTGNDQSTEMKTYYSDYLIDMAGPLLVHDQFGQKHPIPKNGGKTIEFRKYSPLAKATTALTEGVTPDGQALDVSAITATVDQYGGWIQLPDMLLLTAIDNNMIQATQLLGDQAGRTLDTVTREVLNGGTNVQYYDGSVASRATLTGSNKLTVDCIFRAVRALKVQNAKPIDGSFVGIIHPDVAYVTAGGSSGGSGLQLVAPDGSVMPSRGRLQFANGVLEGDSASDRTVFTAPSDGTGGGGLSFIIGGEQPEGPALWFDTARESGQVSAELLPGEDGAEVRAVVDGREHPVANATVNQVPAESQVYDFNIL